MDKVAVMLAVLALGLGAYAAFGTSGAESPTYDTSVSDLAERVASLEAENETYRKLLGVEDRLTADEGAAGADGGSGALAGRGERAVPQRISELEAKLETYDKRFADMEAKAETKKTPWGQATRWLGKSRFLANVDQADKALGLDPGQRAQLERVIESTKADLDMLYDTPNDDGVSLKELMKPKQISLGDEGGPNIVSIMGNFAKVRKFKHGKVPGSNETYAEAEKRITAAGQGDARNLLNPSQQKTWDHSQTDPLFGSSAGGAVSIAIGGVFESPTDK